MSVQDIYVTKPLITMSIEKYSHVRTYSSGKIVSFNSKQWVFIPPKNEIQYSLGRYPCKENGWVEALIKDNGQDI